MHDMQVTVEEWKDVLINGSIAEQLFTYEHINNHINEYSPKDINSIVQGIFPILLEIKKIAEAPNEIILIVAEVMTKMRAYIQDEDVRRGVFIHASKCVNRFLKNYKHARIISELMITYQKEKGMIDVVQN